VLEISAPEINQQSHLTAIKQKITPVSEGD
jgi:hypothetical protein